MNKNGIFDVLATVIPTVGKVVGELLEQLNKGDKKGTFSGGYVGYFQREDTNEDLDKAVFTMEEGRVYLCNTSPNTSDKLTYSTPTTCEGQSDTAVLPGMTRLDVTDSFATAVIGGDDDVFVTTTDVSGNDDAGNIVIYGCNNNVDLAQIDWTDMEVNLGSWLQIKGIKNKTTLILGLAGIAAGTYVLTHVRRLVVNVGNQTIEVDNPRQQEVQVNVINVFLDQPIPQNGTARIQVQAQLQALPQPTRVQDERLSACSGEFMQELRARKNARQK